MKATTSIQKEGHLCLVVAFRMSGMIKYDPPQLCKNVCFENQLRPFEILVVIWFFGRYRSLLSDRAPGYALGILVIHHPASSNKAPFSLAATLDNWRRSEIFNEYLPKASNQRACLQYWFMLFIYTAPADWLTYATR